MQFIDTHSHLYSEEFDADRTETMQRAIAANVTQLLLPAIDSHSRERQEAFAAQYPQHTALMAGLHPTSVKENYQEELALVAHQLHLTASANPTQQHYIAIGEIGLDLYWDTTYREQQIEALTQQLRWANQLQLPVALHIRNTYPDMFEVLRNLNFATYRGVFHCFSGNLTQAHEAIEMGFHLGIGGVLTYKKSTLPDIVRAVPLSSLVLETDCPYLAPVPYRGKRNESAYLVATAQHLAALKETSLDAIADITTHNAQVCFDL